MYCLAPCATTKVDGTGARDYDFVVSSSRGRRHKGRIHAEFGNRVRKASLLSAHFPPSGKGGGVVFFLVNVKAMFGLVK